MNEAYQTSVHLIDKQAPKRPPGVPPGSSDSSTYFPFASSLPPSYQSYPSSLQSAPSTRLAPDSYDTELI